MATKIVKKGAGRPSAMAKKSKHDQRTPLPPKGKQADPRVTREARAKIADEVASSGNRAAQFLAFAREHDWWAGIEHDADSERTVVTCKRDDGRYKETITAEWIGTRVPDGGVNYSVVGGRSLRLRNVSAARQVIDGTTVIDKQAPERKSKSKQVTITGPDGEEQVIDRHAMPIIGANIVDHSYHLEARAPKGTPKQAGVLPPINTLLGENAHAMKARLESEGYVVELTEHVGGECAVCSGEVEHSADTRDNVISLDKKRTAKKAAAKPVKKAPAKRTAGK